MFPIPANATRIRYLESDGTQYIDTGFTPNQNTSAKFKVMNLVVTGEVIIGYQVGNDSQDWRLFNSGTSAYMDVWSGRAYSASGGFNANTWYELEVGNLYIKDATTGTTIASGAPVGSFTGKSTITLNKYAASSTTYSKNRWAWVKIYDNGVLVRDYVPVRVGSIGEMFDRVSGSYATRVGDFILGPDAFADGVVPTRMTVGGAANLLPYKKKVQYLVFDGTQCVETAAPANTMKIRVVYDGDYVSGSEADVLGLYDILTGTVNRVYVGLGTSDAKCTLVGSSYNISQPARNVLVEQTVDIPGSVHKLAKNGTIYTKSLGSFGTFVAPSPIGIGARNFYHTGSPYRWIEMPFSGKVYIFERWDSGVLTARFVPVVDCNGVACFYDEVGKRLHYPWIGNALTAGPDV